MTDLQGPVQLFSFEGSVLQLKEETLERLCHQVGDRKVVLLSAFGTLLTGKSLLLNYCARALSCLEHNLDGGDLIGSSKERSRLTGFKMGNGLRVSSHPQTKGIWIWNRPFLLNLSGEDVAVVLMDTQGIQRNTSCSREQTTMASLSLLLSSVSIFNVCENLSEEVLGYLWPTLEYGMLAMNCAIWTEKPFQNLHFLIRDWGESMEYRCGDEDGDSFLQLLLNVKTTHSKEQRLIRESLSRCFGKVNAFLMPRIGDKASDPRFTGCVVDLSPRFKEMLEKFVAIVICKDNLQVKTFCGIKVNGQLLKKVILLLGKEFRERDPSPKDSVNMIIRMLQDEGEMKSLD